MGNADLENNVLFIAVSQISYLMEYFGIIMEQKRFG